MSLTFGRSGAIFWFFGLACASFVAGGQLPKPASHLADRPAERLGESTRGSDRRAPDSDAVIDFGVIFDADADPTTISACSLSSRASTDVVGEIIRDSQRPTPPDAPRTDFQQKVSLTQVSADPLWDRAIPLPPPPDVIPTNGLRALAHVNAGVPAKSAAPAKSSQPMEETSRSNRIRDAIARLKVKSSE